VDPLCCHHFRDGGDVELGVATPGAVLKAELVALTAVVPDLEPPLLEPADLLFLRFDGARPDPDAFSYLQYGQRLRRGFQDLEGNVTADELRCKTSDGNCRASRLVQHRSSSALAPACSRQLATRTWHSIEHR
jgi:hypothetical protein